MRTWYSYAVAFLIFLTPSNLFFKLAEQSGFVSGQFIDYLIPKIFISDLIIWVLLLSWVGEWFLNSDRGEISFKKIVGAWPFFPLAFSLGIVLTLLQFGTAIPIASLWFSSKIISMVGLGFFLYQKRTLLNRQIISTALLLTIGFQSLVALGQFWTQNSLAGYWFLGESNLNAFAGIAKLEWAGVLKILPYGTTAHPNILAGILVGYWWLAYHLANGNKKWWLATTVVAAPVLLLTMSVSGWMMAAVAGSLLLAPLPKKITSQLFLGAIIILIAVPSFLGFTKIFLPENVSVTRRVFLNQQALSLWEESPGIGVGLNQFTTKLANKPQLGELSRFVQPVHHLGLLWLSEAGVLGMLLAGLVLYQIRNHQNFVLVVLILLPVMALDHYLLTSQSGMLLGVLIGSLNTK